LTYFLITLLEQESLIMTKPSLLVLAAGVGSRYGGLKQLDTFGPHGETIIDYSIYDAIRSGFGKIVFVIRKDIEEAFKEKLSKKYESQIDVRYVFQELDAIPEGFSVPSGRKKPWGTGHAILVAKNEIQEPFGVINGDDFYGSHSFQVMCDYLSKAQDTPEYLDYSMVGYVLRNTLSDYGSVSRGVCTADECNNLKSVVEYTNIERNGSAARYTAEDGTVSNLSGDETVSMNMWGFTPSLFGFLDEQFISFLQKHGNEMKSEFFIPTVINDLIHRHLARVRINKTHACWFGVTYPEDKKTVISSIQSLINQGIYPEKLW